MKILLKISSTFFLPNLHRKYSASIRTAGTKTPINAVFEFADTVNYFIN